MSEKKSLVEEALLQMKNLEQVVTENAKGILASTMKEEIEELVKESLDETEMSAEDESWSNEEVTEDEDSLEVMDIEEPNMGDDMSNDSDSMNLDDMGMDDDDELEPLDMTGASMEEIMAVLDGMGDNDGVIIRKTGDDLDVDKITFQDEDMMESLEESDDDDDDDQQDESTVTESSMTVKPKGMGMGKAKSGLPTILSTGTAGQNEINDAVSIFKNVGTDLALLHCVSSYPMEDEDANLRAISTLMNLYDAPIGYSDHSRGIEVPLLAVAQGAVIIEKHFTFDNTGRFRVQELTIDLLTAHIGTVIGLKLFEERF